MYYSHHAKAVVGNVRNKAKKFLKYNLIEYDELGGCFYCNPIKGYNKTRYKIVKQGAGYECDCQACQQKMKRGEYNPFTDTDSACSHILAVYMWDKMDKWSLETAHQPLYSELNNQKEVQHGKY